MPRPLQTYAHYNTSAPVSSNHVEILYESVAGKGSGSGEQAIDIQNKIK